MVIRVVPHAATFDDAAVFCRCFHPALRDLLRSISKPIHTSMRRTMGVTTPHAAALQNRQPEAGATERRSPAAGPPTALKGLTFRPAPVILCSPRIGRSRSFPSVPRPRGGVHARGRIYI